MVDNNFTETNLSDDDIETIETIAEKSKKKKIDDYKMVEEDNKVFKQVKAPLRRVNNIRAPRTVIRNKSSNVIQNNTISESIEIEKKKLNIDVLIGENTLNQKKIITSINLEDDPINKGIRINFTIDKSAMIHQLYIVNYTINRDILLATINKKDEYSLISRTILNKHINEMTGNTLELSLIDMFAPNDEQLIQKMILKFNDKIPKEVKNEPVIPINYRVNISNIPMKKKPTRILRR